MTRLLTALLCLALSGPASGPAWSQAYPSKAITIVVPFTPGASADGTGRTVANELAPRLGVSVVVENRTGGGGIPGLQSVARATPDGHTLAIAAAGLVSIGPNLPGAVAFDPLKEMAPIARLVELPVVIVNAATGPKTLKEIIERAKSSPNGLTYGSSAPRSSQHLAIEFIRHATGANLVHVPYRGSVPATTDALSGQVAFSSVDLTSAHALIKDGKLNALAVLSPARIDLAPQIPTLAEAGVNGFSTSPWLGLFAPAGTPQSVLKALAGHVRDIMKKPEVATLARNLSLIPAFLDESEFKAFLDADSRQWRETIAKLGPVK